MKNLLFLFLAVASLPVFAQVNASSGSASAPFKLTAQNPEFNSYSTGEGNYFVVKWTELFENIYNLVGTDKAGAVISSNEIVLPMSMSNNTFGINELLVIGQKPYAFVENRNKSTMKNTLTARPVDNRGTVDPQGATIASFPIAKMSNSGDWYVSLTPDKKHVAILWKPAYQKGTADIFTYILLDENLKEISKRQFTFNGYTKEITPSSFYSSDKGDAFITMEEFDKLYTYPIVYAAPATGNPLIMPAMISDPTIKNLSYTTEINSQGELVIAGYTQQKKNVVIGDTQATGTWIFNSSTPAQIKTEKFAKPISNLTALDIVYNKDMFFLVGEQMLPEKQKNEYTSGPKALETNYIYLHNDILVSGFNQDGSKKFEMPISRKWKSKLNFDSDLKIAAGLINNKLTLIYNDSYSKYINERDMDYVRLPVAVQITGDGLMEAPIHFGKELDTKVSSYVLYPQFFTQGNNNISILSVNPQSVKAVLFQ